MYPEDWKVISLGEACESAIDGPFGSNLKTEHYRESGVRVIRLQNILAGQFDNSDQAFISEEHGQALSKYAVKEGDLLLASLGDENNPAGRSCIVPSDILPAIIKADCFRLRPRPEKVDCHFLMWFLNSPFARNRIQSFSHGQTRLRLNLSNARRISVSLPVLEEQQKIAEILKGVDKAIEATQAVIDQTARVKISLLQDLFTNGLPGRHREFSRFRGLVLVPSEWKILPLGEVCESASDGPFGSNLKTEHYVQSGVRVIRLQNILPGHFDDTDQAFISDEHRRSLVKYEVKEGDLLVASMGDENNPAGRSCLVPSKILPAIIKADCFRLRPQPEKANGLFLMWFLNAPFARNRIEGASHGQTRLRLNLSNAKKIPVLLPNLEEQQIISGVLQSVHDKGIREQRKLAQLQNLKTALLHALLTGRKRVKL